MTRPSSRPHHNARYRRTRGPAQKRTATYPDAEKVADASRSECLRLLAAGAGGVIREGYCQTCGVIRLSRADVGGRCAECVRLLREVRDRKSTRLNSSHIQKSRMPSSA